MGGWIFLGILAVRSEILILVIVDAHELYLLHSDKWTKFSKVIRLSGVDCAPLLYTLVIKY